MTSNRFHLGWFMNFTPEAWDSPLASSGTPLDGSFYVDMARAMERACFDYIMIEDTLMISDAYGGSMEAYLKNAVKGPQHDPSPLAALIGASTRKLGVVATFSTMAYPPFLLARLCA
ncbi:MAG: LLM class flavin-dependent oxidoreductase, partial [Gammaproteobacteria bacterium]|nr:LLM class flavin-dependent oxidoreductase [Gammaproteobacteria bacterium]